MTQDFEQLSEDDFQSDNDSEKSLDEYDETKRTGPWYWRCPKCNNVNSEDDCSEVDRDTDSDEYEEWTTREGITCVCKRCHSPLSHGASHHQRNTEQAGLEGHGKREDALDESTRQAPGFPEEAGIIRIQLTRSALEKIEAHPECGATAKEFEAYVNKQERRMYPTWDEKRGASGLKLVAGKAAVLLKETDDPNCDHLATDVRYGGPEHEGMEENYEQNPFRLLAAGESLVVDGSNLVRNRCDHKPYQECNNPGSLWKLLQALEKEREWEKSASTESRCHFVIDASLRHHVDDKAKLEDLINAKLVLQSPPRTTADSLILRLADETNAVVLTNDARIRQDYVQKFPWVTDEARFIRHTLVSSETKHIEYVRKVPSQSKLLKSMVQVLPPKGTKWSQPDRCTPRLRK